MFGNYPQYMREIRAARKNMSSAKKSKRGKTFAAAAVAFVLAGGAFYGAGYLSTQQQVKEAIAGINADVSTETVKINVSDMSQNSLASLLGDATNTLSATEEASLSNRIKGELTPTVIEKSSGTSIDANTCQVNVTTSDGIPVAIVITKGDDGTYKITSVTATLTTTQAEQKLEEAKNPVASSAQKEEFTASLNNFDSLEFTRLSNGVENADEATQNTAYDKSLTVLAENLVLCVPQAFNWQDTDQPENKERIADSSDEAKNKNFVKQYARSYKSGSGSSITIRTENMGSAMSELNGYEAANKMLEYWKTTSSSVATGAGQHIIDGEDYNTSIFYDEETGLWGYWGRVGFTDDNRTVIYDRVVFIDELANQMITVSYRYDGGKNENNSRTLDDFKKLFLHAPTDGTAKDIYTNRLNEILIPAGQTKTVAEQQTQNN